jgi:gliding motility-associated-like protein
MLDDGDTVIVHLVTTNVHDCEQDTARVMFITTVDPVAAFGINNPTGCAPFDLYTDTIADSSSIGSYTWIVYKIEGTSLVTYDSIPAPLPGSLSIYEPMFTLTNTSNTYDSLYIIKLIVGNTSTGCTDTSYSDTIKVFPLPAAIISMANTCDNDTVLFTDSSYSPYSNIDTWQWDFGDLSSTSDTSTAEGPHQWLYDTYGIWQVSLTIKDMNGCVDSEDSLITIWPNPVAAFNYDYTCFDEPLCTDSTITFSDTASTLDPLGGVLDSSIWIVNNMLSYQVAYDSTSYNFSQSWFIPGAYTIGHIIISDNGCRDTSVIDTIVVVDIPVSSFETIDTICITDPPFYVDTIFGNASSGHILHYVWEILDTGLTVIWTDSLTNDSIPIFPLISDIDSALLSQQSQFNPVGYLDYYVQLTVSNCCGSDSIMDTITVRPSPQVDFDIIQGGQILDCEDTIGTYIIAVDPVHLGLNAWIDTANTDYIIVNWGDCATNPLNCTDSIYPYWYTNGLPLNLANVWGFWQQNNALQHNYTTFLSPPDVTITVIAYNECDSDTAFCTLPVLPNTVLSEVYILTNPVCEGDTVWFRDQSSSVYPNTVSRWWWDYDPLAPVTAADYTQNFTPPYDSVYHVYNAPGAYVVKHQIQGLTSGNINPSNSTVPAGGDTIRVYPKPNANFNTDLTICLGETSFFSDTSTIALVPGLPTTYPDPSTMKWYIDNVLFTQGVPSFTTTFTTPGIYKIKLEVQTTLANCPDSIVKYVNVYEGPTALFTAPSTICLVSGNSTLFNGTLSQDGTAPINFWEWDFDTVNSSLTTTFSSNSTGFAPYEYTLAGTYIVELVVTDGNGCKDTTTGSITVLQGADANFIANPVCVGNSTILDASINGLGTINDRWYWDFGDNGVVDIGPNGVINANDSIVSNIFGYSDSVELRVERDIAGTTCTDSVVKFVTIWNLPNPNFNAGVTCFGDTTTLINTSSPGAPSSSGATSNPITNWFWNFGDPFCNPPTDSVQNSFVFENGTHTYSDTGWFTVTLIVTDNKQCKDTLQDSLYVKQSPEASYVANSDCDGEIINYINTSPLLSTIDSFLWLPDLPIDSFVNGTNAGTQDISVIFSSWGQKYTQLIVRDTDGCFSLPFVLDPPVEVYRNPKIYSVSADTICDDTPTTFNHSTAQGSNANLTYFWDYGDLIQSDSSNTTHTHEYVNCNTYQVSLTVEDGNTCSDDYQTLAVVRCNPLADFYVDNECDGDSVEFINQSVLVPGIIADSVDWFWNFGDIPSSQTQSFAENPMYLYDTALTYLVTLTLIDDQIISGIDGCSASTQKTVQIYDLPKARFETNIACEGDITVFTNTSTVINSPPNPSYHWNLADFIGQYIFPSDSSSKDPNFSFVGCNDNYPVELTVTDHYGCVDSVINYVQVYCNPIANFSLGEVRCQRDSLYIMDQSIDIFGAPLQTWNWNFVGLPANPGGYFHDAILYNSPHRDTISTIVNNASGNLLITLDVQDENGCYDNIDSLIKIYDQPYVEFEWNNACAGEDVEFNNLSTPTDTGLWYWNWTFTHDINNSTSLDWSPDFNYPTVTDTLGAYVSATLIVVDSAYCTDTFRSPDVGVEPIEIHPLPIVDFTVPPICEFDSLRASDFNNSYFAVGSLFNDFLEPEDPNDTAWMINNNPLLSSTSLPQWVFYAEGPPSGPWSPGLYNISLTRRTSFGCQALKEDTFRIYPKPRISFVSEYNPMDQCGQNVIYQFTADHFAVDTWTYTIVDPFGGVIVNPPNIDFEPPYTFQYPGIYDLEISLQNKRCESDSVYKLKVYPDPNAQFVVDLYSGCEPIEVNFIDQSSIPYASFYVDNSGTIDDTSYIASYNWSFGDGTVFAALDSPFIPPPHSYVTVNGEITKFAPTLIVSTNNNCLDDFVLKDSIKVYPTPVADIFFPPEEIDFGLYEFDGRGSTASKYSPNVFATPDDFWFTWIPGEGDTIGPKGPQFHENVSLFEYQYQSNSLNQGGREFTVCLIVEEKLYGCISDTCIDHDVDYFKGLYVPNALTPNENGSEASIFLPKGRSLREYSMQIFDSWGNLLFETDQLDEFGAPAIGWDGQVNGVPAQQGTYIWKVQGMFSDKTMWQGIDNKKSGPIYLVR